MLEKNSETTAGLAVELAIGRLECLSILPSVGAGIFPKILDSSGSFSEAAKIIESSPALTVKIFTLIHEHKVQFEDGRFSIRRAISKLPGHIVRDSLLSLEIYPAFGEGAARAQFRKQLILHSLATAYCTQDIAAIAAPRMDSSLAYTAGLLHNIGNLALDQAMPKSFEVIVEQARTQKASLKELQQKHLGTDYTILGKRLANNWHLPNEIVTAIWLQQSSPDIIAETMAEAKIAQIVRLADSIARQSSIGESGSYDSLDSVEQQMEQLKLSSEQVEKIRQGLAEKVGKKAKLLGFDSADDAADYYGIIHDTAAKLAQQQSRLSMENRRLQSDASHFTFITDFLSSIDSYCGASELAQNFAVRWQKFYQTGMVCLYLVPQRREQKLQAVLVENLAKSRILSLNAPQEGPPVPVHLQTRFEITDADAYLDWLFEQLGVEFNLRQAKLLPLIAGGKAVGAIVFELRYPGDSELFEQKFKASASVGASVLAMALESSTRQRFAERFVDLITRSASAPQAQAVEQGEDEVEIEPELTQAPEDIHGVKNVAAMEELAELAAGAAHELNNPLSVISGRAQLLLDSENEPGKKRMLQQIQENSAEIAGIISDLLGFAEPQKPRPAKTDIKQLLDEAIALTTTKTSIEHINSQIDISDECGEVFVDSAQIVSALANILSNSLESYAGELGPVKIMAEPDVSNDFVKLQVSDLGSGMDSETLAKAALPFYSIKAAGRKRGLGLAQASRLIQLNKGTIEIQSQPGQGTTVTIHLPIQ